MTSLYDSLLDGCVLDAGILAKIYLPEPDAAVAAELFEHLSQGSTLPTVPSLVYAECANIFWKAVRWSGLNAAEADASIMDLLALQVQVWPAQELVRPALTLALALQVSVYDATYLALARILSVPLITADAAFARPAVAASHDVRLLSEVADDPT